MFIRAAARRRPTYERAPLHNLGSMWSGVRPAPRRPPGRLDDAGRYVGADAKVPGMCSGLSVIGRYWYLVANSLVVAHGRHRVVRYLGRLTHDEDFIPISSDHLFPCQGHFSEVQEQCNLQSSDGIQHS